LPGHCRSTNITEYNTKVETQKQLVVVHYINNSNTQKEQFHPKNERANLLGRCEPPAYLGPGRAQ
jgi:hypothetical protein